MRSSHQPVARISRHPVARRVPVVDDVVVVEDHRRRAPSTAASARPARTTSRGTAGSTPRSRRSPRPGGTLDVAPGADELLRWPARPRRRRPGRRASAAGAATRRAPGRASAAPARAARRARGPGVLVLGQRPRRLVGIGAAARAEADRAGRGRRRPCACSSPASPSRAAARRARRRARPRRASSPSLGQPGDVHEREVMALDLEGAARVAPQDLDLAGPRRSRPRRSRRRRRHGAAADRGPGREPARR